MNRWFRFALFLSSFFTAVMAILIILMLVFQRVATEVIALFLSLAQVQSQFYLLLGLASFFFLLALISLVSLILEGRLRKARLVSNEIGFIDIGVDAIESIALNAAKAAQSGVKMAKAYARSVQGGKIKIVLNLTAYSDVELPAMMSKVQERVQKDIEKYTGIEVESVVVKVSRVDVVAARVER